MEATNEIVRAIDSMWSSITNFATWDTAKNLANSAFFASLVAALAGAFAGAFAAQRIAERGKHREELLREIRNTNAAIAVAYGPTGSVALRAGTGAWR